MTALVTWWRVPENALYGRFGAFDVQGIVPVAYSMFAVALGVTVGSIFKRVLPAIATTLGSFVAIRVLIALYLRPHYMAAKTVSVSMQSAKTGGPPGAWVISSGLFGPNGRDYGNNFSFADIPAPCRDAFLKGRNLSCLSAHGLHEVITFQPAARFWTFQGIEAGLFAVLAAGLLLLA